VHAPSQDKSGDAKDSLYEELEHVFYHFPKYHMKILLGDFNAKLGRENIFKPIIGNESLHQDSNDNVVSKFHQLHQKSWLLRAPCFRIETFISTPGTLLMGKLNTRFITY
jgi:hypothetical protein